LKKYPYYEGVIKCTKMLLDNEPDYAVTIYKQFVNGGLYKDRSQSRARNGIRGSFNFAVLRTMLNNNRKNLKIRNIALTILFILFLVFLIHPGRFSVINVTTVTDEMFKDAKLKYSLNIMTSRTSGENLKILKEFQNEVAEHGKVVSGNSYISRHYACEAGGTCSPKLKDELNKSFPLVAIVVPFRDRQSQLSIFLPYMHQLLQDQGINYTILVVEQVSRSKFNRAKLLNIGYEQVLKTFPDCKCFIFHDVDLIPINADNYYVCLEKPRHMISSLNEFRYNLPYPEMTGGALAISSDQFVQVHGFSNQFYGWGGEDDEFHNRLAEKHLQPIRLSPDLARYVSLKHVKQSSDKSSVNMDTIVPKNDGLKTLNYTISSYTKFNDHTLVRVVL